MKIFRKRILYIGYIICTTVIFLYYLFPSQAVKEYLADQLNQAHPNLTVQIDRAKLAFPPGIRLYDIKVYHLGRTWIGLKNLKISPNILSLILSETHLSFKGNAYDGILSGNIDIVKQSPLNEVKVDADLFGIRVEDIPALKEVSQHKITGKLDGNVALNGKVPNQKLTGNLTLSDGKIEFSNPFFNQKFLTFRNIDADLVLNNRALTIKRCQIEGNQIDANISGSVKLYDRSGKKILNLSGTLTPHHALLAQLKNEIPVNLLAKSKTGAQGFSFKIKGAVDSPEYSFY